MRRYNYVCLECGEMRRWPNCVMGKVGGIEVKQGENTYYYPPCNKCGAKMEFFGDKSDSVIVGKMKPEERAALAKLSFSERCEAMKPLRDKYFCPRPRKVTPDQNLVLTGRGKRRHYRSR